jgi:hypothetical protein
VFVPGQSSLPSLIFQERPEALRVDRAPFCDEEKKFHGNDQVFAEKEGSGSFQSVNLHRFHVHQLPQVSHI